MERLDGQLVYMYNSLLATKDIYNARRSAPYSDTVTFRVAFGTPNAVLDQIRERATAFVQSRPGDYGKRVWVIIDGFNMTESVVVKVFYSHRSNMQVGGFHVRWISFLCLR